MKNLSDLSDFKALKITLASPEEILQWTHGEVTKPETINYRTFRPEKDGLFDERIFGPTKDYECYCGKYKRIRYKGVICDKCGVEVTHSRVRRERVGHIVLACPVVHVWYFRGIPSQLGILLEVSPRDLESVVYFSSYLAVEVKSEKKAEVISQVSESFETAKKKILEEKEEKAKAVFEKIAKEREKVKKKLQENKRNEEAALAEVALKEKKELGFVETEFQKVLEAADQEAKRVISRLKEIELLSVIPESEYFDLAVYLNKFATLKMGAEAVLTVLQQVDLEELSKSLKRKLLKATGQNRLRSAKRLRLVEGFRNSGVNPTWTVLKHLVVIPPELRPMVQLEGGRFATSDLNDLYRRVINRNNRLRKLLDLGAPEIIIRNEKRMLQEAVDSLIDSSKQRATVKPMRGKQELRSLSDMLKGKQGRFRKNLLGKRVDYSGRSVIVVGPNLRLDQCGLPKEMVLELFKPFVLGEILKKGLAPNLKSARFVLERRGGEIWDILEGLTLDHPVLLNRAPTLHRLGIRAFYPILIDGSAIQVHPCVCTGFNADFDGDQMAVHVPLSQSSKKEAQELMLSTKNLLSPASGSMVTLPNRDMLVGCYYLTTIDEKNPKSGMIFGSRPEALLAYQFGKVKLRSLVKVLIDGKILETTVGRIIFNSALPVGHDFFNAEINRENNALKVIIEETLAKEGEVSAVTLIDDVKRLGFHYATEAGYSMGLSDCIVPSEKPAIIKEADEKVAGTDLNFRRGLITKREKLRLTESIWMEVTNRLDELSRKSLSQDNPLRAMVVSGARGTWDQVKQICGTRGLIVDPLGRLVELPIKSNYMEGLSGFEYFASARGARKGLVDTALKTADAGYLTRRLVDVAQDVIVRTEDCDTYDGIEIIKGEEHLLTSFADRLYGRVLAEDLPDPRSARKVLLKRNSLILDKELALIKEVGVSRVKVRSAVLCEARFGICSMCYGLDLARQEMVKVGIPVGIIAAQSIGEPGTQLTLRTKHVSGIVTSKDVTQGLPRIEELFEARVPKFLGILSETVGKIDSIIEKENSRQIHIKAEPESGLPDKVYELDLSLTPLVKEGDLVSIGTQICEGYLDLTESLRTRGYLETSKYIIVEIQKVYSSQGVSLNDKHVEVIVRQMFSRLRTENSGDSKFLPGEIISKSVFFEENNKILEKDKEPATAETVLLGITKSALQTESFLAAASFIETTRELTEASITGKIDRLLGLKENVIIGRLIPVGERARIE